MLPAIVASAVLIRSTRIEAVFTLLRIANETRMQVEILPPGRLFRTVIVIAVVIERYGGRRCRCSSRRLPDMELLASHGQ